MSEAALPRALLLDTCALIWLANGDPLARTATEAIDHAGRADGVFVSSISGWEIGLLSKPRSRRSGALQFLPDPKTWFAKVLAGPGIWESRLTSEIAIDASFLPGALHGDPGDRMIIATARSFGLPIVTRDRRIIDYGADGHVQVIRC
jgi:PIN domain nuclease of toxin-antitoxin system